MRTIDSQKKSWRKKTAGIFVCLGIIPNTVHFSGTKLRSQASERFVADAEEEYEDSLGNVIPKKTYVDLRRRLGLL